MKLATFLLVAGSLMAQPALAETHIFLVDSSDGYGIDRCLASGEACGKAAAAAICHNRKYAEAIDYGRIDAAVITDSVSNVTPVSACSGSSCRDIVAITCSR